MVGGQNDAQLALNAFEQIEKLIGLSCELCLTGNVVNMCVCFRRLLNIQEVQHSGGSAFWRLNISGGSAEHAVIPAVSARKRHVDGNYDQLR